MIDNSQEFSSLESDFSSIYFTVVELFKADQDTSLVELLDNAEPKVLQTSFDNWNGGTCGYTVYLNVPVNIYVKFKTEIDGFEKKISEHFDLLTRQYSNENVDSVRILPKSIGLKTPSPDPHRPFSAMEQERRAKLLKYLDGASEDQLIEEILLPLFRQLGFHRITPSGHKDKALEYGKDIWMKYSLPTQHILYFGIQAKKGKLDSSGNTKNGNANVAEIYNQVLMMLGHEIFDPEIGKRVLVDHAFIVAGGEITKQAKNWIGGKLDASKRSQILFMDRDDILNLFVVTNLPLPSSALQSVKTEADDGLPF